MENNQDKQDITKTRTVSLSKFKKKKFKGMNLSDEWTATIGEVGSRFTMTVTGLSGHGKTTFVLYLAKELANYGKVYFNSLEQGPNKSLHKNMERCNLFSIKHANRIHLGNENFNDMLNEIKNLKNIRFIIIDSVQYMHLTYRQYQYLKDNFKELSIILISHEYAGKPDGDAAKKMEYDCEIKGTVKNGVFTCRSRLGTTIPMVVIPNFKLPRVEIANNKSQTKLNF